MRSLAPANKRIAIRDCPQTISKVASFIGWKLHQGTDCFTENH